MTLPQYFISVTLNKKKKFRYVNIKVFYLFGGGRCESLTHHLEIAKSLGSNSRRRVRRRRFTYST